MYDLLIQISVVKTYLYIILTLAFFKKNIIIFKFDIL